MSPLPRASCKRVIGLLPRHLFPRCRSSSGRCPTIQPKRRASGSTATELVPEILGDTSPRLAMLPGSSWNTSPTQSQPGLDTWNCASGVLRGCTLWEYCTVISTSITFLCEMRMAVIVETARWTDDEGELGKEYRRLEASPRNPSTRGGVGVPVVSNQCPR